MPSRLRWRTGGVESAWRLRNSGALLDFLTIIPPRTDLSRAEYFVEGMLWLGLGLYTAITSRLSDWLYGRTAGKRWDQLRQAGKTIDERAVWGFRFSLRWLIVLWAFGFGLEKITLALGTAVPRGHHLSQIMYLVLGALFLAVGLSVAFHPRLFDWLDRQTANAGTDVPGRFARTLRFVFRCGLALGAIGYGVELFTLGLGGA